MVPGPEVTAVSVPYLRLHAATAGFSHAPYAHGGHKLGEGGSGEVFYCNISLVDGQGPQEIAVKLLRRTEDPKVHAFYSSSCIVEYCVLAGPAKSGL